MTEPASDVTVLLHRVASGERRAVDDLLPVVYEELRRQAQQLLRHERPGQTMQATALVHEAYLRLIASDKQSWVNRAHFFAAGATAIRRILVERARRRSRIKRGGGLVRVPLEEIDAAAPVAPEQMLAIDDALSRLEALDPDAARVVELRYFAGLSVEEAAAAMNVSASTVARLWRVARAWLHAEIKDEVGNEAGGGDNER